MVSFRAWASSVGTCQRGKIPRKTAGRIPGWFFPAHPGGPFQTVRLLNTRGGGGGLRNRRQTEGRRLGKHARRAGEDVTQAVVRRAKKERRDGPSTEQLLFRPGQARPGCSRMSSPLRAGPVTGTGRLFAHGSRGRVSELVSALNPKSASVSRPVIWLDFLTVRSASALKPRQQVIVPDPNMIHG